MFQRLLFSAGIKRICKWTHLPGFDIKLQARPSSEYLSAFSLQPLFAVRFVTLSAEQNLPPSQISPKFALHGLAQHCPILPSFLKNDSFKGLAEECWLAIRLRSCCSMQEARNGPERPNSRDETWQTWRPSRRSVSNESVTSGKPSRLHP